MSKSYFTLLSVEMCGGSMLRGPTYFCGLSGAASVIVIAVSRTAGRSHFIVFLPECVKRAGRQAGSWQEQIPPAWAEVVESACLSYTPAVSVGQTFPKRCGQVTQGRLPCTNGDVPEGDRMTEVEWL